MPADDVSDLKDVVDAINRLCETMKASDCEEVEEYEDCSAARSCGSPCSGACSAVCSPELVGPEQVCVRAVQALRAERCGPEPPCELQHAAGVALAADAECEERGGVVAGHVAAMRERFESMTRANTPCPDLLRPGSPCGDLCRNVTPSPDTLG